MKKFSALLALFSLCAFCAVADTAIPSGKAVYDITLTFTDYPELYEYGAWPIEIDLTGLGQTFYGERVAVSTNIVDNVTNIALTVRGVWDVQKIIDTSNTEAYTGGQSHIYTRNRVSNYYSTNDGGIWTSFNGKYSFSDVSTVEAFGAKVANGFLDTDGHRTMSKPASRAETGTPVMLNGMTMKLVRTLDGTACAAGTPVVCKLRVRFSRPLSNMGYETVSQFRLANKPSAGTVFDIMVSNAALSDDGAEIFGLVNVDVGSILTLINSEEYTGDSYKGQTRLYLNGSSSSIAAGSQALISSTDGMTVADLSEAIKPSIIYRDYSTAACRVVGIDLEPKSTDGGLLLMRW